MADMKHVKFKRNHPIGVAPGVGMTLDRQNDWTTGKDVGNWYVKRSHDSLAPRFEFATRADAEAFIEAIREDAEGLAAFNMATDSEQREYEFRKEEARLAEIKMRDAMQALAQSRNAALPKLLARHVHMALLIPEQEPPANG